MAADLLIEGCVGSPGKVKNFNFPYHPDRLWGPPNLLPMGAGGSFLNAAGA
jgi:hypothetical protein